MKWLRRYILLKLTIDELVEYFNSIGVNLDFTFGRKQKPKYYAKNSRLYKRKI